MLEELLLRNGYQVFRALSGKKALETAPGAEPDLILIDVRLPDIDGFTLSRELKGHEELRDIPIVFMSALDDVENKVRGFEHGDDHISKPIEPREALARIERQVTVSRVRQALRESEAKFRSVMESAIDAIVSSDVSGKILSWNRAAAAVFGYSAEEALGQPLELIIPERFRDAHRRGIDRVSSGGPSRVIGSTVELAAVRKGGEEFPIELSLATWLLDEERYYTGIIRDISERKEAEQKFRSVTESAIDAIISADHTGRIMSWNSAATEILGYTAEEAVGQPLEIIIPERFHEPHREGMRRVTSGGESRVIGQTVELFARTRSGEEVPIELSLSTWTVRDERYYTGIIRDISERKQAENQLKTYAEELSRRHEELKLAQGQLVESEKQAMLGRLLAGILHEVNTPLGALLSTTDTIGRIYQSSRDFITERCDADDPSAARALRALDLGDELASVLSTSAGRIQSVIDGLAHFVTPEGAEHKTQDIREGLESVITVLGPQLGQRIRIVKHFPDEPAAVRCDPARLNQAFLNLLQNAVEAIDGQGEIQVAAEVCESQARVTISDNGRGMTPEQISSAFDFNFTKKAGRVRLRLGLATTKRAIEDAGGTLTLESHPGQGTEVRVVLPIATG
jgi:PAS domain S-box-containing protein